MRCFTIFPHLRRTSLRCHATNSTRSFVEDDDATLLKAWTANTVWPQSCGLHAATPSLFVKVGRSDRLNPVLDVVRFGGRRRRPFLPLAERISRARIATLLFRRWFCPQALADSTARQDADRGVWPPWIKLTIQQKDVRLTIGCSRECCRTHRVETQGRLCRSRSVGTPNQATAETSRRDGCRNPFI